GSTEYWPANGSAAYPMANSHTAAAAGAVTAMIETANAPRSRLGAMSSPTRTTIPASSRCSGSMAVAIVCQLIVGFRQAAPDLRRDLRHAALRASRAGGEA